MDQAKLKTAETGAADRPDTHEGEPWRPESTKSRRNGELDDGLEKQPTNGKSQAVQDGTELSNQMSKTTNQEPNYPPFAKVLIVVISLMMAIFLAALDRTVIATAIPSITNEFNSLDDVGWYGSAFMITASAMQMPAGRLCTFCPPKAIFLISIAVFEIGSALCGAAPNSVAFILGRAITGAGAAGIQSSTIVLLVAITSLEKRPRYIGLFGAIRGISSLIGPLLGGALTTGVSWRWCFYISLPIGGTALLVIFFILPSPEPALPGHTWREILVRLDLFGNLLLLPGIICLILALQWGGAQYAWSDSRVIACLVIFAAFVLIFAAWEYLTPKTAMLTKELICNRSMLSSIWFIFSVTSVLFIYIFYIPIWFQAIKNLSAIQSGIRTIPLMLAFVIGTISAGQLVSRTGYYAPFMILSCVFMPIGAGLVYTFDLNTSESKWIGYPIFIGFGAGLGLQQPQIAAQTVLKRHLVPTGLSMIFFLQQLGGAIFVSVGQNVLNKSLIPGIVRAVPGFTPAMVVNTGATKLRKAIPPQYLLAALEAYNQALRQVFLVGLIMAALGIVGAGFIEWKSVKSKKKQMEAEKKAVEGEKV